MLQKVAGKCEKVTLATALFKACVVKDPFGFLCSVPVEEGKGQLAALCIC